MYKDVIAYTKEINPSKLLEDGFKYIDSKYSKSYPIMNDRFTLFVALDNEAIYTTLIDNKTKEEYTLHKNEIANGAFNSLIKEEYNMIISSIIERDITNKRDDVSVDKLKSYIYNKYNIVSDYPFEDDDSEAFRRKDNRKWFGLLMNLSSKKIGLEKDIPVRVINIKVDEDKLLDIIDNKHFFICYHMNKKKWISILLNDEIDYDKLFYLIDRSYELVK